MTSSVNAAPLATHNQAPSSFSPRSLISHFMFLVVFFMLFFISLTEKSIAEFSKSASIKVTLFHLFYFYFLWLFGTLGTVDHPKPSLFLSFKVVSN
jgi:hypothetical protein